AHDLGEYGVQGGRGRENLGYDFAIGLRPNPGVIAAHVEALSLGRLLEDVGPLTGCVVDGWTGDGGHEEVQTALAPLVGVGGVQVDEHRVAVNVSAKSVDVGTAVDVDEVVGGGPVAVEPRDL